MTVATGSHGSLGVFKERAESLCQLNHCRVSRTETNADHIVTYGIVRGMKSG